MRATRSVLALLLVFALSGVSREALAGDCDRPLTNTCVNSDTLWPNPGPTRFVGVAGTELVAPGLVGFGLVASYHSRPILLHVASPGAGGTDQPVVDDQVNANFLFAYGVADRLQLDFALPVTLVQSGGGTSSITGGRGLSDTAVRDLRFGLAYAIVPRARIAPDAAAKEPGAAGKAWALAGRFHVVAPTGDQTDFAGERAAVFVPSVAADYRLGRFFFGAELGARVRPVAEFAGARVGTQLATGLGAGYDVLDRELLSVLLEARTYWNLQTQHETVQTPLGVTSRERTEDRMIFPAEWMLGVRSAPVLGGDVSFHAGGGGPIPLGPDAITVPRYRFMLGAVYAPTERDTDHDGIPDKVDFCPFTAGPRGGEQPGCPRP